MTDQPALHQSDPGLQPGDLCHHGHNALPLYRVIWVDSDKAWLRDVNSGGDSVVQLGNCQACSPNLVETEPPITPQGPKWPDGTPRP